MRASIKNIPLAALAAQYVSAQVGDTVFDVDRLLGGDSEDQATVVRSRTERMSALTNLLLTNNFNQDLNKAAAKTFGSKTIARLGRTNRNLFDIQSLDGYGCWCRVLPDSFGSAKGVPVDGYDEFCNVLYLGTLCLAMDYGEQCNPWDVDYLIEVGPASIDCTSSNGGDPCKEGLCNVESKFVLGLLETITNFDAPPLEHSKYNPNSPDFTSEWSPNECIVPRSVHNGNGGHARGTSWELQCCGQYPERSPYKSVTFNDAGNVIGEKACCNFDNGDFGFFLFNEDTQVCCDGALFDLGNVCS